MAIRVPPPTQGLIPDSNVGNPALGLYTCGDGSRIPRPDARRTIPTAPGGPKPIRPHALQPSRDQRHWRSLGIALGLDR